MLTTEQFSGPVELTLPSKTSSPWGRFRRSVLPKFAVFCGTWCDPRSECHTRGLVGWAVPSLFPPPVARGPQLFRSEDYLDAHMMRKHMDMVHPMVRAPAFSLSRAKRNSG